MNAALVRSTSKVAMCAFGLSVSVNAEQRHKHKPYLYMYTTTSYLEKEHVLYTVAVTDVSAES